MRALRRPALLLLAALAAALLLGGCAGQQRPAPVAPPPPPPARAELLDLQRLPQDPAAYFAPEELDRPFLAPKVQDALAAKLREQHFAPWHRQRPAHSRADALWGLAHLKQGRHYGENLRPLEPDFRARMEEQCQAASYPNTLRPGIATATTDLRVLPTQRPGFLKPDLPGEGFPFDYWQNSLLIAGTPVLVTHSSADGAWLYVESRMASGWVPAQSIGFVDETFMARMEALPLAAITREGAPIAARSGEDGDAAFLFSGRIGMLLPMLDGDATGLTLLAPAREPSGRAVALAAFLPIIDAEPAPLVPTPRSFSRLARQLMGQPYGWGGYLGNRDCSALMLDLLAPFGVYLPRNSRQQARQGQWIPWTGLEPQAKETQLMEGGIPLLTLVHKPGHIMLYLGKRNGRAVILHDIWGLRTRDPQGREGRYVVGRVAITSLTPGAEVPEVAKNGLLLDSLDGMTILAPSLAPAPAPAPALAPALPASAPPAGAQPNRLAQ